VSFPSSVHFLIQGAQKVFGRNAGKHSGYIYINKHQQTKYSQALSLALRSSNVAELRSIWLNPLHPAEHNSCIQAAHCKQFLAPLTMAQHYLGEGFLVSTKTMQTF